MSSSTARSVELQADAKVLSVQPLQVMVLEVRLTLVAYPLKLTVTPGMLSLIAALDLGGSRNISKFIHAYGNPRTFNPAAAAYYSQSST